MSWEEKIMKSKTSYFNKVVFKKRYDTILVIVGG